MNDIEKAMKLLIDSKRSLASCINVFLDNHMFGYGFDKKDRYNEAQELSELYYKLKGE